ncbi:hypothetical protein D3C80_1488000 [compost metagenome]
MLASEISPPLNSLPLFWLSICRALRLIWLVASSVPVLSRLSAFSFKLPPCNVPLLFRVSSVSWLSPEVLNVPRLSNVVPVNVRLSACSKPLLFSVGACRLSAPPAIRLPELIN